MGVNTVYVYKSYFSLLLITTNIVDHLVSIFTSQSQTVYKDLLHSLDKIGAIFKCRDYIVYLGILKAKIFYCNQDTDFNSKKKKKNNVFPTIHYPPNRTN